MWKGTKGLTQGGGEQDESGWSGATHVAVQCVRVT